MFAALLAAALGESPRASADTIVDFNTNFGTIEVALYDNANPTTVANFLNYVTAGTYTNSIVHRSANIDSTNGANDIVQGGGFNTSFNSITPTNAQGIGLVYNAPNVAGTLAMASTSAANSETTQWYFNVNNNSSGLDPNYSVFGNIISGMNVLNTIAALPTYSFGGAFTNLPLQNYSTTDLNNNVTPTTNNLVVVNSITESGSYQPLWQNSTNRFDVLGIGKASPGGVLAIVQYLEQNNAAGTNDYVQLASTYASGKPYYDVDGDGFVTAQDATQLISQLNNASTAALYSSASGAMMLMRRARAIERRDAGAGRRRPGGLVARSAPPR